MARSVRKAGIRDSTGCRRFLKDFLDVEALVRANGLDLKAENVRNLFLKYGTLELYDKVSRAVASG